MALTLGLEQLGIRVWPVLAEPLPPGYDFLPGADRLGTSLPHPLPDLGIVVDCDGSARLGPLEPVFLGLPELIDIDHHATRQTFGTLHWVDPRAAAAGELIARLLRALRVRPTPQIATNIYTAILTDTGRFSYSNTSPAALRTAARMVAAGASPVAVYRGRYESKSLPALHLLGRALCSLTVSPDGMVAWAVLDREAFAAAGAGANDTESIIDVLRTVRGGELALLFSEQADGSVRASLRSRGKVNVARLARAFGGGGHPRAAGCTLPGPLDQAVTRLLAAARQALADAQHALAGD